MNWRMIPIMIAKKIIIKFKLGVALDQFYKLAIHPASQRFTLDPKYLYRKKYSSQAIPAEKYRVTNSRPYPIVIAFKLSLPTPTGSNHVALCLYYVNFMPTLSIKLNNTLVIYDKIFEAIYKTQVKQSIKVNH